ncbi:hypothetical protein D3C81_1689910 [compost metagenome]
MHAGRNQLRSDVHHHIEITVVSRQHRRVNQILTDVQSNGVAFGHIQIGLYQHPKSVGTRIKQGAVDPHLRRRKIDACELPGDIGREQRKKPHTSVGVKRGYVMLRIVDIVLNRHHHQTNHRPAPEKFRSGLPRICRGH